MNIAKAYYRQPDWLHHQYCRMNLSVREIATICECDKNTIKRHMDTLGIQRRTITEYHAIHDKQKPYRTKKRLERVYRSHSLRQMARLFDVNPKTIWYWLNKHRIRQRTPVEAIQLWHWKKLRLKHGSWFSRIIFILKEYMLKKSIDIQQRVSAR